MVTYSVPLKEMNFLLNDVLNVGEHYGRLGYDLGSDDIMPIMQEIAKFAEKEVHSISRSGDIEGVHFEDGKVTLPKGWVESYKKFAEAGWNSIEGPTEYGGQHLPATISVPMSETLASANACWGMLPGLTTAAVETLVAHGSDKLKNQYLPNLISGQWFGTMCLTEAHAGTDLGMIRTKATPIDEETYSISGEKIFITGGDHDAVENIIHLVLARLPDAPEGTAGISLFVVPKININSDQSLAEPNKVTCSSIEHKMGIKASPTCVLNFDGSKGYLVGQANKGMTYMFTMMNTARIGTGIQGLGIANAAYQGALEYSRDRIQMRSLTGIKAKDKPADPIIVHPDVRKMLLTQKALIEGSRALSYYGASLVDLSRHSKNKDEVAQCETLLALLTPVIKGFVTEVGNECTSHALQCFGGHGYIGEHGIEQLARDARITTLYEGTTGIQALDMLGRKVLMTQGQSLKSFTYIIHKFCEAHKEDDVLGTMVKALSAKNKEWGDLTMKIGMNAMANKDAVGGAAVDYLMYSGYVSLGYFWLKMAAAAKVKIDAGEDLKFAKAKLETARFYFDRILPRTLSLASTLVADIGSLMNLEEDSFGLDV